MKFFMDNFFFLNKFVTHLFYLCPMIFLDFSLSVSGTFDKSAGMAVGCAIENLSEIARSIIILFIITVVVGDKNKLD